MLNEESLLLLMGKTAKDKKSYLRQVPRIDLDETLFTPEKAAPQPEYTTSGCYDPKLRELAEIARSFRQLPKMTNQKKTDYICISKESEGPVPDTLDETLSRLVVVQ